MKRLTLLLLALSLLAAPVLALEPLSEDDLLRTLAPLGEDGRPAIWRSDRYPDYYWDLMETRGDTADSVRAYFLQIHETHGPGMDFWPLEAKAVAGLWALSGFAQADNGYEMLGLPGPDDMAPEQVLKLAQQAFLKESEGQYTQADYDSAQPTISFIFSQRFPKGRVWLVEHKDARREGGTLSYIELDPEDGAILRIDVGHGSG
ncbi:MAG: hypothetical protein GX653_09830 [Clostridiales bacterium]|nr:hypothetical protein [Clostridiales bacterium]